MDDNERICNRLDQIIELLTTILEEGRSSLPQTLTHQIQPPSCTCQYQGLQRPYCLVHKC